MRAFMHIQVTSLLQFQIETLLRWVISMVPNRFAVHLNRDCLGGHHSCLPDFAKVCFFVLFHEQTCTRFTRLFVRLVGCHHARNTLKTLIMLYFWKVKGPRTSKMIFWTVRYTNTNSQIHIYSLWWSARNTQHVLYFWKAKGPRTSNMIFWTVKYTNTNAQMHKYKFTKTRIHKYSIWQNDRNTQQMFYSWTAGGSRM